MNIVLFVILEFTQATFLAVAHGAALDRFSVHESLSMWPDSNYMRIENSTPEECAEKCLAGTFPGCKSFRYKPEHKKCDLLVVAPDGDNVLIASTQGWDFYTIQAEQPTGQKALTRFSLHESLSMWPDNNYQRIENSTPEECAEKCLAGTFPGCKSFRYKSEHKKCDLLVVAPGGDNVLTASTQGWDFYTMQTEQPTVSASCEYRLVKCESFEFKRKTCNLPGKVSSIQFINQYSQASCTLYTSYGPLLTGNAMWVDHGCRGQFHVKYCAYGCHEQIAECSSQGFRYAECQQPGSITGISVVKQKSKSPCTYGKSYGFDEKKLWVAQGCRARFSLSIC